MKSNLSVVLLLATLAALAQPASAKTASRAFRLAWMSETTRTRIVCLGKFELDIPFTGVSLLNR